MNTGEGAHVDNIASIKVLEKSGCEEIYVSRGDSGQFCLLETL